MSTRLLALGILLSLLDASLVLAGPKDRLTSTDYFPTDQGFTWTYRGPAGKTIVKVARTTFKEGVVLADFESSVRDFVVAREQYAVKPDGVYRVSSADKKADPPLQILKLPLKKGASWKVKSELGDDIFEGGYTIGAAFVTVPAGKFETIVVTSENLEVSGENVVHSFYYASGVGLVKQVLSKGSEQTVIELTSYTPARR